MTIRSLLSAALVGSATLAAAVCAQPGARSQATDVYPAKSWQRWPSAGAAGFSRRGLDSAVAVAKGLKTSAFMVVVGGRSLLEYGNVADTSYLASARKSLLSMLYGKYVENGTIRLDRTLAQLGIDDIGGLSPQEREATVENLISARSGIYHPASNPGDATDSAPPRGSVPHGSYYLYNNWDFNAAGDAFEIMTKRGIYDAFDTDIAKPIGLEDWHREAQQRNGDTTRSVHKAYHFVLSTRDMARVGYLMLREGRWRDRQVVPRAWVRMSTRMVTHANELHPVSWQHGEGYGYLWWVQDPGDTTSVFDGAYSAQGAFGQYIMVIPKLDMVVAHKVVVRRDTPPGTSVNLRGFRAIVDAVIAARCPQGRCAGATSTGR